MKKLNIIILSLVFLISLSCKAQITINIEDNDGSETPNVYYKDTNNLLDPFVGTWVFDNGTQYLKIVFEKKTMVDAGDYHEDLLIGEFQYKENGVELVNTLSKLTNPSLPYVYHHSIHGNYINTYKYSPFNDYTTDVFRIELIMGEPNGYSSNLDVRIATVNGQPAIQIFKAGGIRTVHVNDPPPAPIIPDGFYFLMKQ
ncbi:DUF6705 family protein [Mesonia sp. K7]|uniref:DUF6705 family protein n=1 Tax=Mesonia sp. K7 TaxID=2218606 RepID=UPI000DA98FC0|nr:DUF6705 family protein [Mesonia sp. K7]PZD78990.1 hypothetical protein DNG35_03010 [Mesonia sp. K7]